jgi:nucleoside-diphosphate-sugar epimerase
MIPRRLFVAGVTGAIGRRLVPFLVAAGHDVTGITRSRERAEALEALGVQAVVVDAFDADALTAAVAAARPDVVIHQLTDLGGPPGGGLGSDRLARTARLRTIGTANLVRAAVSAGAGRIVAQSLALCYAAGPEPHGEEDPLGVTEPWMSITLPGLIELERQVRGEPELEGIVLRYGLLYGPGAATDRPDDPVAVHVDAAAAATALAVDHGAPGVYNVVDDGGPVSNAKARAELGWHPETRLPA